MATTHISLADAARDLAALIARVNAGEEIIIESDANPVAVIIAPPRKGATIAETLTRMEASTKKLGYEPTMDAEFAADMEEIIRNRKPRDMSTWD
jgi:prevent-host-death family protein